MCVVFRCEYQRDDLLEIEDRLMSIRSEVPVRIERACKEKDTLSGVSS